MRDAMLPIGTSGRKALGDEVAERVREEIIRGTFPPGFHLRESDLAVALEVSRGPIRDALLQIEHEGLVVRRRHRGAVVVRLSRRDLDEVYDLRLVLERLAMRRAAVNASDRDVQEMEEAVAELKRTIDPSVTVQTAAEVDLAFHDLVYRAAGHRRLHQFWHELRPQVYMFLLSRKYVATSDFRDVMVEGHLALIEAVRSRDEEHADRTATHHVRTSYLRVVEGYEARLKTDHEGTGAPWTRRLSSATASLGSGVPPGK